ncbi:MAG: RuBisCO large subunit C-terminal-like domain-containing protein [bacterium]
MKNNKRFSVHYSLLAKSLKEAKEKAWNICIEQTIEFPYALVKQEYIKHTVVGKIENLKIIKTGKFLADISYDEKTTGFEFTQFLNVLFGNSSLKPGIRVEKIILSTGLQKLFKGPRFGAAGLRKLTGAYNRPLICSALKPMGLSSNALAVLAYKFALGGVDIIKDDHGLANQSWAPFKERVVKCAAAVKKANKETISNTLYAPNITSDFKNILSRARFAKKAGAGALVLSPGLSGFDIVRELANDNTIKLPLLLHPAFLGGFTSSPDSGISHAALYGQLARLAGADISIFPNFGGRFSFSKAECKSITEGCKIKMGTIKNNLPGPGGGMSLDTIKTMKQFYGNNVIFLIGGGLFADGTDITSSVKKFKRLVI